MKITKDRVTGLMLDQYGNAYYKRGGSYERYVPYYGQAVAGYGQYVSNRSPITRIANKVAFRDGLTERLKNFVKNYSQASTRNDAWNRGFIR